MNKEDMYDFTLHEYSSKERKNLFLEFDLPSKIILSDFCHSMILCEFPKRVTASSLELWAIFQK
jgi:hypothetical protein